MGWDIDLMVRINREGATRIVILTKRFAIKIPNVYSYTMFLHGLLANRHEIVLYRLNCTGLCPIIEKKLL